jgi:hypothetical protein
MDYYNRQRPHTFSDGIPPAAAEKSLRMCPGLVDHYTGDAMDVRRKAVELYQQWGVG